MCEVPLSGDDTPTAIMNKKQLRIFIQILHILGTLTIDHRQDHHQPVLLPEELLAVTDCQGRGWHFLQFYLPTSGPISTKLSPMLTVQTTLKILSGSKKKSQKKQRN